MNKFPKKLGAIGILSGIIFSQTICFAQTINSLAVDPALFSTTQPATTTGTTTTPASTTTTDPNATSTTTQPEPTYTNVPAGVLAPASSGQTTTSTTQPTTTPTTTNTTPTQPATTTQPTNTGIVPIRKPPVTTTNPNTPPICPTVPPAPTDTPPVVIPECPVIPAPLPPKPVIPELPLVLIITPILGVALFWIVLSTLNRNQLKSESRMTGVHLKNAHSQSVSASRDKAYRHMLDFLTMELSSSQPFNQHSFQQLSSKIELLGSDDMKAVNAKISDAFQKQNHPDIKKLLGDLASQIRKES